jgi:ferritin-like metal-binding protein YciE
MRVSFLKLNSARDLLLEELRDLYSAENQLVDAGLIGAAQRAEHSIWGRDGSRSRFVGLRTEQRTR